jgi:GNAT superfamily N-acetyltransferase
VKIRRLGASDWQTFKDVRLAALQEAPFAFGSTWENEKDRSAEEWQAAVTARARFVAETDGRVVGMAAGGESLSDSGSAALTSMWVDPGSRGRGTGGSLVRTVLEWARGAGFGKVLLWVTEDNPSAERLYERNGFTRTGESQPVRDGETRLEYEMSRRL